MLPKCGSLEMWGFTEQMVNRCFKDGITIVFSNKFYFTAAITTNILGTVHTLL